MKYRYRCPYCNRAFKTAGSLQRHKNVGTKPGWCWAGTPNYNRKDNKMIPVIVTWDVAADDGNPPSSLQYIPAAVWDDKDEDSVTEYLTEKTGWLVNGWRKG